MRLSVERESFKKKPIKSFLVKFVQAQRSKRREIKTQKKTIKQNQLQFSFKALG